MKKSIAFLLTLITMLTLTVMPVFADETNITVTADAQQIVVPSFQVQLPSAITLTKNGTAANDVNSIKYEGTYTVNVTKTGDWSTKYALIKPTNSTFTMKASKDSSDTVSASVTQENQKWSDATGSAYLAFNTSTTGTVKVFIPNTKNDIYSGTLVIEYSSQNI